MRLVLRRSLCLLALVALPGAASALSIELNYSYDTNGFFTSAARFTLQAAASELATHLSDNLLAITPSGSNSWSPIFDNPATGEEVKLPTSPAQTIAANTVRVYVGARNLGGDTLGIGGPGGFSVSGSSAWVQTVQARGQTGALASTPTDFGPWGGSLTFDLSSSWYFDQDVSTFENIGSANDFYSVALHELAHLLGLGTADAWRADLVGQTHAGAAVRAAYGSAAPISADQGHWAEGTMSTRFGTNIRQEAAMSPALLQGSRTWFTTLDYAGLSDTGWQVIPEPGPAWCLSLGLLTLGCHRLAARARRKGS